MREFIIFANHTLNFYIPMYNPKLIHKYTIDISKLTMLLNRHHRNIIKPHRILRITRRFKRKRQPILQRHRDRRHDLTPQRIASATSDLNTDHWGLGVDIIIKVDKAVVAHGLHEHADLVLAARRT